MAGLGRRREQLRASSEVSPTCSPLPFLGFGEQELLYLQEEGRLYSCTQSSGMCTHRNIPGVHAKLCLHAEFPYGHPGTAVTHRPLGAGLWPFPSSISTNVEKRRSQGRFEDNKDVQENVQHRSAITLSDKGHHIGEHFIGMLPCRGSPARTQQCQARSCLQHSELKTQV